VAVALAVTVIPTLVVPVPRPTSLNAVFSAPVLVSMLLSANWKCGLSAAAGPAASTSADSTNASGPKSSIRSRRMCFSFAFTRIG
jgi:hypothetical protein